MRSYMCIYIYLCVYNGGRFREWHHGWPTTSKMGRQGLCPTPRSQPRANLTLLGGFLRAEQVVSHPHRFCPRRGCLGATRLHPALLRVQGAGRWGLLLPGRQGEDREPDEEEAAVHRPDPTRPRCPLATRSWMATSGSTHTFPGSGWSPARRDAPLNGTTRMSWWRGGGWRILMSSSAWVCEPWPREWKKP